MTRRHVRTSWIDQFVLREDVNDPFVQAITAAQQVARVAEDRIGLSRVDYEAAVRVIGEARAVEDLALRLADDVARHAARADDAVATEVDAVERARALTASLTGVVRATATLLVACHRLLELAEQLLAVRRPYSRLTLMAAVESTRAAASAAHLTVLVNLPRITDVTVYDELAGGLPAFDATLAQADRVAAALRSQVTVAQTMPLQHVRR